MHGPAVTTCPRAHVFVEGVKYLRQFFDNSVRIKQRYFGPVHALFAVKAKPLEAIFHAGLSRRFDDESDGPLLRTLWRMSQMRWQQEDLALSNPLQPDRHENPRVCLDRRPPSRSFRMSHVTGGSRPAALTNFDVHRSRRKS
jgi:hypothetical protein